MSKKYKPIVYKCACGEDWICRMGSIRWLFDTWEQAIRCALNPRAWWNK